MKTREMLRKHRERETEISQIRGFTKTPTTELVAYIVSDTLDIRLDG
jgi:hypothetical protein